MLKAGQERAPSIPAELQAGPCQKLENQGSRSNPDGLCASDHIAEPSLGLLAQQAERRVPKSLT